MNRRDALSLLGKSAAAGSCLPSRAAHSLLLSHLSDSTAPSPAADEFETRLQTDMARLATRVYSEQGIPMLLTCEDLTAKHQVSPASRAMNDAVAPAFQKYFQAWQRLNPDAPAADVGRLVELLADRDFTACGQDNHL